MSNNIQTHPEKFLKLRGDVVTVIAEAAAGEHRSFVNMVEVLIREALAAREAQSQDDAA